MSNNITSAKPLQNQMLPAVLRLTLKKKWYDMIKAGIKKEEYREVKRYWIQRLCNEVEYETNYGNWEGVFKKFIHVEFKNGYGKNAPTMLVEFKGLRIGEAKPEWSDNWQGEVFFISLGAVISSVNAPEWLSTQHRKDMLKELWNTPNVNDSNPRIKAIQLASTFAEEYGYKIDIKKAMEVIRKHWL